MFTTVPDKIVWCYGIYQSLYDEIPDVTFIEGLPSNIREHLGKNTLVIIDDLMSEGAKDKRLTHMFTRGSHHLNMSVIFITQNFFHKGKEMREITLNAHYLILCKNRRDLSQIRHLGMQLYPKNFRFLEEAYYDSTRNKFSYLLIDLHSETPEEMRLRTNIFPGETQIVYQPK